MIAFATLFVLSAVRAICTGRLKVSYYDHVYRRSEDPGTFWLHVVIYFIFACAFIAAAAAWS
jgi:hypothetical protein